MGLEAATSTRPDVGALVFRFRNVVAPCALAAMAISARRADFLVPRTLDPWVAALGVAAIVVGLALRFATVGRSRIRRSGVHKSLAVPTLYVDGPYACCRNPLYVANAIILTGLAAVFDSRWMVFAGLPAAWIAIAAVVAAEERTLAARFGARYGDYCARVPRFVPRAPLALLSLRGLDWGRALRKEHDPIFATISAAILLSTVEDMARHHGPSDALPTRVAMWLVAAAAWMAVRVAKRAGRLRAMTMSRVRPPLFVGTTVLVLSGATVLSVALAVGSGALTVDRLVEAWLQGYPPSVLHRIAYVLDTSARVTLGAIIVAALIVDGRRRLDAWVGALRVASGAFVGELLKTACERLRPSALPSMTTGNSIPSGHIMNTTLVAVVAWELADALPRSVRRVARGAAVATVVAQAFARVLHGSHWPSDVAPSVLLGVTWMLVAERIWRAERWRVPLVVAGTAAYVVFLVFPGLRFHLVSAMDRPRMAVAFWDAAAAAALVPTDAEPASPTAAHDARSWSVRLESPAATPDAVELVIGAHCRNGESERCRRVRLSVNGSRALALPLHCGWHWYSARAPAVALRRGMNTVVLHAPVGCPPPKLGVQSLALVVDHPPPVTPVALAPAGPHA